MREKYDKNSPLIKNLKKLLKPCKDYERVSAWGETLAEIKRV